MRVTFDARVPDLIHRHPVLDPELLFDLLVDEKVSDPHVEAARTVYPQYTETQLAL